MLSPVLLMVSCSDGGSGSASPPQNDILGCMDNCALNYNANANIDDGLCIYSFLGTYTVSELKMDGVSLFSNSFVNPLVAGAIAFGVSEDGSVGIYGSSFIYSDGLELNGNGQYANSLTQLIFYPSDGSPSEVWTTTKVNCLEFDGYVIDADGALIEIELDYYSSKLDNLYKTPTELKFDVSQFKRK